MHIIQINPMATEDLIDIRDYLVKDLKNQTAAVYVLLRVIESYEKLKEFSMMGIDLSTKVRVKTDFRYLFAGSYIIFYRADNEFVYIYRVLYAGRDYLRILFPNEFNIDYLLE